MFPHPSELRGLTPPGSPTPLRIGVGIDTSRYGHYAAFLRDDLQPAAAELQFAESATGYAELRQRLEQIVHRHGSVHFIIRLDAAGQYADNLLHFLHSLASAGSASRAGASGAEVTWSISCGDPQRNKNYRAAIFGSKKSDAIEVRAAARYAVSAQPAPVKLLPEALRTLRQVAGRLQAVVRQRTRLINQLHHLQLHHLLALAFPELALLVKDIASGWVLEVVHRYPTASLLAQANEEELAAIPYLPNQHIGPLLQQARSSIASLSGPAVPELVRDQVRQLRDASARQKRLENLLVSAYHAWPTVNHLDTIPGIGAVSAAVLTAFILDIDRFETPGQLVAYFGTLPIEASSGVERDGKPRRPKRYVMSPRGNDLVRRYLWMAALSALRFNPAARALYARVVAKHPDKKAIAVGHVMRKLLHLVFAIWKTRTPFDAQHYPWGTPAHVDPQSAAGKQHSAVRGDKQTSQPSLAPNNQAAGLKSPAQPVSKEVTAARNPTLPHSAVVDESTAIDFVHLKRQLTMARVLDQLGLAARLRGSGPQRRCRCPLHRGDARGRTFSVNLDHNVFQCFDTACAKKGDIIDLWASVNTMSLREAAIDLVRTFALEPTPRSGTEKRNG